MKGVQCYELFGGIELKIHTFSFFSFSMYVNGSAWAKSLINAGLVSDKFTVFT